MAGRSERRIGRAFIANVPIKHGVVGRHVVDLRRARFRCRRRIDGGGQHAIVHDHFFASFARLRIGVGDDDGDVIADVAHFALREGGMAARFHRRAVLGMDHPAANEAADLIGGDMLAGENGDDARHFGGCRAIDAVDGRMSVRRAHKIGMGLARAVDVIDIAAFAGDEANIFLALDRGADAGCAHSVSPRLRECPLRDE